MAINQIRKTEFNSENIPEILKKSVPWILWKRGVVKPNGRFSKIPCSPETGNYSSFLDKNIHLPFEQAVSEYQRGKGDGVGIVLNGNPIDYLKTGELVYLVGIDLDDVHENQEEAKLSYKKLDTYTEYSPSKKGLRMFAISKEPIENFRGKKGCELFSKSSWLTVTSQTVKNRINCVTELTIPLKQLRVRWSKSSEPYYQMSDEVPFQEILNKHRSEQNKLLEEPSNIEIIRDTLTLLKADTSYENWRDIIWAVASLEWKIGLKLLTEWSKTDSERWNTRESSLEAQNALEQIYNNFSSKKGITVGTLFFKAGVGKNINSKEYVNRGQDILTNDRQGKLFNILSRDQLKNLPPPDWLVSGLLVKRGAANIFGPPKAGKSFLAIDLAVAISNGENEWFDLKVEKADVLYIALEGKSGLKKRIDAWEKIHEKPVENLKFLIEDIDLLNDESVSKLCDSLVSAVGKQSVVFIDTLSQASLGADENSSKDMGRILSAIKKISNIIDGLVVLIHHTGKDSKKGARGHSSLSAAMDAEIFVDKREGDHSWSSHKIKDGDANLKRDFELTEVKIETNNFGELDTSCAIKPTWKPFRKKEPQRKNQKIVFESIKSLFSGEETVSYSKIIQISKDALINVTPQHRASRGKEALTSLIEAGFLKEEKGFIYLL